MKGFKFLLTLFIAITAAFLYGCSASDCNNTGTGTSPIAPSAAKGTISGTVRDTDGNPVGGATVTIAQVKATTISAADGTYSFSGLVLGRYSVTAVYNGITLTQQEVTLSSTTLQAIADFVVPVDGTTPPAVTKGTISGTVRYSNGDPVVGRTVVAISSSTTVSAETAQDGTYSFPNLELGSYTVRVSYEESGDLIENVAELTATNPNAIVDFTLPAPLLGTISGIIKNFDGSAPDSAIIDLHVGGEVIRTMTTTDGRFLFEGLELGEYVVAARPLEDTNEPSKSVIISEDNLEHSVELQYDLINIR